MALKRYDDIVSRIAAGFWQAEPIYGVRAFANYDLFGTNSGWGQSGNRPFIVGWAKALKSLPSGVTAYLIPEIGFTIAPNRPVLIASMVNLGSIDISGASGTFTDGAAFPTATELGSASSQLFGPVLAEVTVVLSASPGSITITYKNQAGTGSQSTGALALSAAGTVNGCNFLPLAAGDYGVEDITAVSRSGGSTPTGTVKFWGIIPVAVTGVPTGACASSENFLINCANPRRYAAAEQLAVIQLGGSSAASGALGSVFIVGDN